MKPPRIHDLSRKIDERTVVYPGDPEPRFEPISTIAGKGVNLTRIMLGSHTGTHADARSHFLPGGHAIDAEPLEKFVGEALVVDASSRPGHGLAVKDLESHIVNENDILLFYTGTGSMSTTHFTYLEISAAEWIAAHRIKCIGIDTLSVEKYGSKDAPVHKLLLSNNIGIVENLANLEQFIGQRLFFMCFPLPLGGVDGSPARAVFLEMIK
ncbi:MAG TPA: cyclase family protein [Nitrososphaera sp.]|nr:cyclase family protein [Nitrososphaera sp.]